MTNTAKLETAMQMIARLREEKQVLLATIKYVEDWAFGEGYFITPTLKAKFDFARKAADDQRDLVSLEDIKEDIKLPKVRKAITLSPEERERRVERGKVLGAMRRKKP